MSNPPSHFLRFADTPFESFILPIIPANAPLKDSSSLSKDMLGKIPGRWLSDIRAWTGFGQWQNNRATKTQLKLWQDWQTETGFSIAVGMRTSEFPVVDIDSDDVEIVRAIHDLALGHLGWSPARCREESPRRVLCYKWTPGPKPDRAPVRKMRFAFTDNAGKTHIVEILGSGQQVVIEGPHAKGKMHYWLDGKGLVESHPELVDVSAKETSEFLQAVKQWAAEQGFTPVKLSLPTSSDRAAAVKIDNLMSPHLAKDMDLLARCLREIDINDERLADYDTWCALFRAIKAACGGDQAFYAEHVLPWLLTNPTNAEEDMEAKWNSFHDSQLGYEFVYQWAAQFGFTEGIGAIAEGLFANDPTPTAPQDAAGSTGGGGLANGGSPPSPPTGGPTAFPFTDKALSDQFAAQRPNWRHASDQGWVRLESGVYVPHPGVLHPIMSMCSDLGELYRLQGGTNGAKIDQVLKSTKKASEVERACRCHPQILVMADQFDVDPWLLNTPDFIIDLRDRSTLPHGTLMRNQTLVTPDIRAYGVYERYCPRWLDYLHFFAADRPHVIPFLRRWGASSLVGEIFDVFFLFIHGVPGTGKTVFLDVLSRLIHTYGMAASMGFFMRSLDKRTFELFQMAGKRAVFTDEVPKGSTWDEMLLLRMLSGAELSAEGKGKDFKKFRSVATITITGNHKPAFVTSAEESGIDRRLVLLTANKKIKDYMPDNTRFAEQVVREEGPAILMWFIEEAMAGWRCLESTGSFMGDTTKELELAAAKYRRSANPFLAWIEEDMEAGEGFDIESTAAFKLYMTFMREQNPKYHVSKDDFRNALEALGFKYDRRSSGKVGKGRCVFKGLRQRPLDDYPFPDEDGKVVQFPTPATKEK